MEIKLSEKQFRRLLDLVYIGNWVLNSTRGDDRIRQYDRVESLIFSALAWWCFGLWCIGLTVLFSTSASSSTVVLLGTGCTVLASYLTGFLPKVKKFVPTKLMDGNSLIYGLEKARWYFPSLIIALGTVAGCVLAAIALFPKKQL